MILSQCWNQNHTCFCQTSEIGFNVYKIPLDAGEKKKFQAAGAAGGVLSPPDLLLPCIKRRFHSQGPKTQYQEENNIEVKSSCCGVACLEMLFFSNFMAIVGGGRIPVFPSNKVVFWDDHKGSSLGELRFRNQVLGVKMKREVIVIVLLNRISVYQLDDFKFIDQLETYPNPFAAVGLSVSDDPKYILATPSLEKGHLRIEIKKNLVTLDSVIFPAHKFPLAIIGLNTDGSYIATASEQGTVIRIFDRGGHQMWQLRRGISPARITSIDFDWNSKHLIVASNDKSTVHLFELKVALPPPDKTEESSISDFWTGFKKVPGISHLTSLISSVTSIIPFSETRSVIQFRIPFSMIEEPINEESKKPGPIVTFGPRSWPVNTFGVLTLTHFFIVRWKPSDWSCQIIQMYSLGEE